MVASLGAGACASLMPRPSRSLSKHDERAAVIARAQVWTATPVRAMDLEAGPRGPGSFAPDATVSCEYVDKQLAGKSPKFACKIGRDDEVKVKFGGTNGEVYGEVLSTRLLWALGFGADRMYPVRVICRGCPTQLAATARTGDESRFDTAVIERKMRGAEWPPDGDHGWSWKELDTVDPERGGAPMAHRDALKLLAVFLQHTDSKSTQQRIVCLGQAKASSASSCARPFLMISDVGLTFGSANHWNLNAPSSVNLRRWAKMPVWKDDEAGCVGNLPRSFSGTMRDPVITESGRRFLAQLLTQLSDRQLHDLFAVAQVDRRLRSPGDPSSGFSTVEEWVGAFKQKRAQIVERRCI
jgi:hypothetical protein